MERIDPRPEGGVGAGDASSGGGVPLVPETDQELAEAVHAAFFLDAVLPDRGMDVRANDRVVYLRGTVETQEMRQQAEVVAARVQGVNRVVNMLRLASTPKSSDRPARQGVGGSRPAANTREVPPVIDRKFLVERRGRTFALYAGLLEAAHRAGLRRIQTRLLQAGTTENGDTWVVSAEVETAKGIFSGIGDASPTNVAASLRTALPRLAETRAKARALRDALNAGALVSFEELGEHEESSDQDR